MQSQTKFQQTFFWGGVEIDHLIRKFIWKYKEPGKAKTTGPSFSTHRVESQAVLPSWTVLLAGLQV